MSVFDLLFPNSYNLNCKKLITDELVSKLVDLVEARVDKLTGTEIISDKIQGTLGFNYLSPWDSAKSYILNDLVVYNNQIWRCLVSNTNVAPDPNNPAQTQWVQTTSNNAILNERQLTQINLNVGNDIKALVSAVPFQSIDAAVTYLSSIGGGLAKIMTVGQNNIYGNGSTKGYALSNIILDGGDESDNFIENPQNIMNNYLVLSNVNNSVIKNISWTTPLAGEILRTNGCRNMVLQNVSIIDPVPSGSATCFITGGVGTEFGNHTFLNCWVRQNTDKTFAIQIAGNCLAGTIILIDNLGLLENSNFVLNLNLLTTPDNLTLIVRNSYVSLGNASHKGGKYILQNCIIKGPFNAVAGTSISGSVTILNCSLFDPSDNTWASINFTGTAEYKFIDCLTNPNSSTDIINISGNVNSLNYTSGPASKFNRLATWSPGIATSLGTTQAIVPVLPGAILSNTLNILTYNSGTGAITFSSNGVYQLLIGMDIANTNTTNDQTTLNYWLGINGSTEATSLATSSTDRGFVGSAGILATYPNSRRGLPLVVTVTSPATSYFFYVRNLSATSYNVTIQTMAVLQIR